MATLAAQPIQVTGTTPAFVAASAGGDACQPAAHQFLRVKNGDASSHTVTLAVPGSEYGQARPDVAVVVAAGADVSIDLPAELLDSTTGLISWTYDAVTSVTVAVCRV